MADPVDLDGRLDDVFATAPKEFTAERDALVRDLKACGRADDAATVKALRKPTVAVAAVNRAAREHAADLAELVDVGQELTAVQRDRDADRDALRDLTRRRRALLVSLTDLAASTTERPDGARAAIAATLDAASLDEQLRDDLLRGRLTAELAPAARFVLGAHDGPTTSRSRTAPRRAPAKSTRSAPPPRDELAVRRARAELDAVRARAESADESLREHTDAAADARERLDAVQRHLVDLEAALAATRADLADAKRDAREAERATLRARAEAERVAAALQAAERTAATFSDD